MSSQTKLATLWCPACKKMTIHRVTSYSEPRCLVCEDQEVSLPPLPPPEERKCQYPLS